MLHIFLSTLPARGATCPPSGRGASVQHFYPRSPRGERRLFDGCINGVLDISIHAPREGSDSPFPHAARPPENFYPRSPRGERPSTMQAPKDSTPISIHAPREGSDSKNREENPCFCFIIQHSARIWKNCFYKKGKTGKNYAKLACYTGAKETGKRWVLYLRTGWQARVKRAGDRPAQRVGERRRVRPCFGSGCPADRSADCPERGR